MKLYGRCPKKHEARDCTVVRAWRNLTGLSHIPQDQDYWTLAGPMYDETGGLQPACELNHVLGSGLLRSATQFHSIEVLRDVHEGNRQTVAHLDPAPHLYHGEAHRVIEVTHEAGLFRPAIINLDSIYEPRRAARLLGQVLHVANRVGGVKMVVLNAIVDAPRRGRRYNLDSLVSAIERDVFCRHQLGFGWRQSIEGWVYNGTGRTNTKMGTLIFFQPYQEAAIAS